MCQNRTRERSSGQTHDKRPCAGTWSFQRDQKLPVWCLVVSDSARKGKPRWTNKTPDMSWLWLMWSISLWSGVMWRQRLAIYRGWIMSCSLHSVCVHTRKSFSNQEQLERICCRWVFLCQRSPVKDVKQGQNLDYRHRTVQIKYCVFLAAQSPSIKHFKFQLKFFMLCSNKTFFLLLFLNHTWL